MELQAGSMGPQALADQFPIVWSIAVNGSRTCFCGWHTSSDSCVCWCCSMGQSRQKPPAIEPATSVGAEATASENPYEHRSLD